MKVGICDWGIGGLGIYKLLRAQTNWDISYFSDSGYTPYGKVAPETLLSRWNQIEYFFQNKNVEIIIIACNALGTIVPHSNKIFNVLQSGLNFIEESNIKKIGVTGGHRTIESELFQSKANSLDKLVICSVGQPLSAHIESGDVSSGVFLSNVKKVFAPLTESDAVVLACTHYPAIKNEINFLYPNMLLIDPAEDLCNTLLKKYNSTIGSRKTEFITTGNSESFVETGGKAFKIKISINSVISIQDLPQSSHN